MIDLEPPKVQLAKKSSQKLPKDSLKEKKESMRTCHVLKALPNFENKVRLTYLH